MQDLPPTDEQVEQARKFLGIVGKAMNVDDFDETLQNDDAFELWDNISTEEYIRQGGEFKKEAPNEPVDLRFFEDCQRYATFLICDLYAK